MWLVSEIHRQSNFEYNVLLFTNVFLYYWSTQVNENRWMCTKFLSRTIAEKELKSVKILIHSFVVFFFLFFTTVMIIWNATHWNRTHRNQINIFEQFELKSFPISQIKWGEYLKWRNVIRLYWCCDFIIIATESMVK